PQTRSCVPVHAITWPDRDPSGVAGRRDQRGGSSPGPGVVTCTFDGASPPRLTSNAATPTTTASTATASNHALRRVAVVVLGAVTASIGTGAAALSTTLRSCSARSCISGHLQRGSQPRERALEMRLHRRRRDLEQLRHLSLRPAVAVDEDHDDALLLRQRDERRHERGLDPRRVHRRRGEQQTLSAAPDAASADPVQIGDRVRELLHAVPVLPRPGEGFCDGITTIHTAGGDQGATQPWLRLCEERLELSRG